MGLLTDDVRYIMHEFLVTTSASQHVPKLFVYHLSLVAQHSKYSNAVLDESGRRFEWGTDTVISIKRPRRTKEKGVCRSASKLEVSGYRYIICRGSIRVMK